MKLIKKLQNKQAKWENRIKDEISQVTIVIIACCDLAVGVTSRGQHIDIH